MQAEGAELVKHYRDLAFMGFAEVVANLGTILNNLSFCKRDVLAWKPDVLILVDYPGFNLRIATFARENGIKVFYYISPQIWAWKRSRIHKIKRDVDEMFVILPFEKAFYAEYQMQVHFEGHPLLDALSGIEMSSAFRDKYKLDDRPILALLPGSRKQEIRKMLPVMVDAAAKLGNFQVVVAGVSVHETSFYTELAGNHSIQVIVGDTYQVLLHAHVAAITSGTATLEAGLIGTPMVVCYKGGNISYAIAKKLIQVKYISLVNLILDKPVVKELIQHEFTADTLAKELKALSEEGNYRSQIKNELTALRQLCGGEGSSSRVAKKMVKHLRALR